MAVQGLAAALPSQLLKEIAGLLLGVICRNLLSKLFALQSIAPADVDCVAVLLKSALAMGQQVFAACDQVDNRKVSMDPLAEDDVPGWAAMTVAADLLGSDFSRFHEQRKALVQALSKEEAMKLMQLSWRDETLSPEEAWIAVSSAN